ncbi:Uncharacterized protein QTN25_003809 [Entamoeba marina]
MSASYRDFVLTIQDTPFVGKERSVCSSALERINTRTTNPYQMVEILQELLIISTLSLSVESFKFFIVTAAANQTVMRTATMTLLNTISKDDETYLLLHTNTIQLALQQPFNNTLHTCCAIKTLPLYITKNNASQYSSLLLRALQQGLERRSKEYIVLCNIISILPRIALFSKLKEQQTIYIALVKVFTHKNIIVVESLIAALVKLTQTTQLSIETCSEHLVGLLRQLIKCKPIAVMKGMTYPLLICNILRLLTTIKTIPQCLNELMYIMKNCTTQLTEHVICGVFIETLHCISKHFPTNLKELIGLPLETLYNTHDPLLQRAFLSVIKFDKELVDKYQSTIAELYLKGDSLTSLFAFEIISISSLQSLVVPQSLQSNNMFITPKLSEYCIKHLKQLQQPIDYNIILTTLNCFPLNEVLLYAYSLQIVKSQKLVKPLNSLAAKYALYQGIQPEFVSQQSLLFSITQQTKNQLPPPNIPQHIRRKGYSIEMRQRLHECQVSFQMTK